MKKRTRERREGKKEGKTPVVLHYSFRHEFSTLLLLYLHFISLPLPPSLFSLSFCTKNSFVFIIIQTLWWVSDVVYVCQVSAIVSINATRSSILGWELVGIGGGVADKNELASEILSDA
jgi:hypothetical protein